MAKSAKSTVKTDFESLTGPERAAVLMLALGDEYGEAIWGALDDDEVKEISQTMANLGTVSSDLIEKLLIDFVQQMSSTGSVFGTLDTTERLLTKFLPKDRVAQVLEEIRGPAGRTMWDKLGNVNEQILATYLKSEYPQTVSVVLSKIRPDHASKVLAALPEDFAVECMNRMLRMESVQKDILDKVETTLRQEFMSNLARTQKRDAHEQMAEIFNTFDRQTEGRFMTALEDRNRDAAERIKSLMFTFEDLSRLDSGSMQTLLRSFEKDKLALALKGASPTLRDQFFASMSERAAKILKDDMESMGPVRLKDVDTAQTSLVALAKELADKGEIMLSAGKAEDELVY
ncbi:MAG: flagellar motor switch protein FliG [Alphaproteobacteria bacterium]|jgi:flagellar motor switch protein FliG